MTGYPYHIYTWRDIPITYIHDGISLSHIYMPGYPYHIYTWRDMYLCDRNIPSCIYVIGLRKWAVMYICDRVRKHIYMKAHFLNPITYIHDGSLSSLVGTDTSIKQTSWRNVIVSARIYNSVICCILHGALRCFFFKRIRFFIDIARYTTRAIIFYDVFINTGISYTYNYYFIGLLSYTIVYI
jgi:hypothetical protein